MTTLIKVGDSVIAGIRGDEYTTVVTEVKSGQVWGFWSLNGRKPQSSLAYVSEKRCTVLLSEELTLKLYDLQPIE